MDSRRSGGEVLRILLWRALAVISGVLGLTLLLGLLDGSPGRALRGGRGATLHHDVLGAPGTLRRLAGDLAGAIPGWLAALAVLSLGVGGIVAVMLGILRLRARGRRGYVRLRVVAYRTDAADAHALARMYAALHAALAVRWWRRLTAGQPSVAVEVHHAPGGSEGAGRAWLAVSCPDDRVQMIQSALQAAYPNTRLAVEECLLGAPPAVLRLKKRREFIRRTWTGDRLEREPEPAMNRLMTVMGACGVPSFVQIALTPAPASLEGLAKHLYKHHEAHLSRRRREHPVTLDRSLVDDAELRGGLEVQHRSLFFVDIRVVAPRREECERIASALRVAARREPPGRARDPPAPGAPRSVHPARPAGRGQPRAGRAAKRAGAARAGRALAAALGRLHDGPLLTGRAAACPCPARGVPPGRGSGHAPRRARSGLDPRRAAPAEHGGAGHSRAGQVELPGRQRRRGPAPGALRRDRASTRRGTPPRQPSARCRPDAHARCWTSPIRPAASTRSRWTRPPT